MAENLRTTTYNDGTPIPNVKTDRAWEVLYDNPGYCWYNNDSINAIENNYGAFYNYSVV